MYSVHTKKEKNSNARLVMSFFVILFLSLPLFIRVPCVGVRFMFFVIRLGFFFFVIFYCI